jgi:hypothetical protein
VLNHLKIAPNRRRLKEAPRRDQKLDGIEETARMKPGPSRFRPKPRGS